MNITIELNEVQHKNLIAFLERSTMTGLEAIAFVELMNILNSAKRPVGITGGFSRKGDETT